MGRERERERESSGHVEAMPDTAEGTATHMRANRQTKELSGIELLIEIRILIHFFDCCMNQTSNSAGGLRRGEGGKGGGELTAGLKLEIQM